MLDWDLFIFYYWDSFGDCINKVPFECEEYKFEPNLLKTVC